MEKQLITLALSEIHPYEHNPRKNDHAVDDVAESIRQCGYVAPIIVDEEHTILAGHTRYKALQKLGYKQTQVLVVSGLTEEQARKYRLLDNKTGEKAAWDFGLLECEFEDLDFEGYDFGWELPEENEIQREEIKLSTSISVVIECETDEEAEEVFERLQKDGYKCHISTL